MKLGEDNMTTKQVVDILLNKENEIDNKINEAISELLRLGYESERGKALVDNLLDSIKYTIEEMK